MLPAAVLAGGLGSRVRHRTGATVPKALLPIAGVPFIDRKLTELRDCGVRRVVLLVGHGGDAIEQHVGDGSELDISVVHVHDPPGLLGTGGAIRHALGHLGDAFFVTYGDTLLEVPMAELQERLLADDADAVMTVFENVDRWETSNVDVDGGLVSGYEKPATPGRHRFLDYGMLAMRARAFDRTEDAIAFDLSSVIRDLVDRRALLAFPVRRRFYDIGNEQSILETEAFLDRSPSATPLEGGSPD
jgi:NDP-sugar pyrophosphorylase family protein